MQASPIVEIRFYFADDDQASGRHTVFLPLAYLDIAPAFAIAYADLVASLSDSALVRINIIVTYVDSTSQRGRGSDLNTIGVLTFDTADAPPGLYVLSVPSIRASLLLTTGALAGIAIDSAQPPIAALVNRTISGAIRPIAVSGAYLTEFHSGYAGKVP